MVGWSLPGPVAVSLTRAAAGMRTGLAQLRMRRVWALWHRAAGRRGGVQTELARRETTEHQVR